MQRHNCLPRPSGAGHTGGAGVAPLDQLPLLGMQEDGPFVPRELQRPFKLLDVGHQAEPALRVGMIERTHCRRGRARGPIPAGEPLLRRRLH